MGAAQLLSLPFPSVPRHISAPHRLKLSALFSPSSSSSSSCPSSRPHRRRSFNLAAASVVGSVNLLWAAAIGAGGALVGAAVAASMASSPAGRSKAQQASLCVKRGMELFVQGDVNGSLVEFDRALELDPRQKPYLWQRGLSLYYVDRFSDGATQFREDVAVNPNDTEEAIWAFLCEAQIQGVIEARKNFLEVGLDRRPVMRKAQELFKHGGDPDDLIKQFKDGEPYETFYAHLYAGLYHEAQGNPEAAKAAMLAATATPYGSRSSDYMAMLAKVHCKCRGWNA